VRSIGLILTLCALSQFGLGVVYELAKSRGSGLGLVLLSVPALIVGLWLLRGAPGVVRFAFPDES
jgi:hypothetical protein